MALFQKKPVFNDSKSMYSVSLVDKTFLIVGLGNLGKEYNGTRHNIGFECLDYFAESQTEKVSWQEKSDFKCRMATIKLGSNRVILLKPTTFMNLSGDSVRIVANFYKIPASSTLVIHDELDINFGQIRTRVGGGSAGHNGVKSIIDSVGEGFGRIRIGIGPKSPEQIDSSDFVLAKFSKTEKEKLTDLVKEVAALTTEYIYAGKLPEETRSFIV